MTLTQTEMQHWQCQPVSVGVHYAVWAHIETAPLKVDVAVEIRRHGNGRSLAGRTGLFA